MKIIVSTLPKFNEPILLKNVKPTDLIGFKAAGGSYGFIIKNFNNSYSAHWSNLTIWEDIPRHNTLDGLIKEIMNKNATVYVFDNTLEFYQWLVGNS